MYPFKRYPFKANRYKPVQTYTNLYKPIQMYTKLYKPIQTYTNVYKTIQTYTMYTFVYVCIGLYSFVSVGVVLVWFSVGGMGRASWARLLGTLSILALKGYLLKGYLSGHLNN